MPKPDWRLYERMVARLLANDIATGLCVTPNARVRGRKSGRLRQVDVLIDLRHDTDNTSRTIVDAKMRTRKIDVTNVEAFQGMMEDVGAKHGVLVCPHGFTKAAEKRASKNVSIHLIPLEALEHFDPSQMEKCAIDGCKGFVFWDGYPELSLGLMPVAGGETRRMRFIHYVGKCDYCSRFHVKCCTCQTTFSLGNEDEHKCECQTPWFWLSSIEADENGEQSMELHVILFNGEVVTTSRKPR